MRSNYLRSRIRYFTTSVPGAGIFLPIARAVKIQSPTNSHGSIPLTPTTPSMEQTPIQEQDEITPPSIPQNKFSQSVSVLSSRRPQSPATFRPKSRPSLPRPESPLRRPQATTTPSHTSRQSLNMLSQSQRLPAGTSTRYAASPTPAKMGSVRGVVRAKPPMTPLAGGDRTTSTTSTASYATSNTDRGSADLSEVAHLQSIIAEKNAKIASLTAEFDAHRADFRSTLDTLEMASTETERVYEKKVEDLLEERRMLMAQGEDVESVARQLRQLEEVVQELEEGLEDARRGEAEARGEVEFLRGEVERVRAELRRERERNVELVREVEDSRRTRTKSSASKALNGTAGDAEGRYTPTRMNNQGVSSPTKRRSKALTSPEPKTTTPQDSTFTPEQAPSPIHEAPPSPISAANHATPLFSPPAAATAQPAVSGRASSPTPTSPLIGQSEPHPAPAPTTSATKPELPNDPDKWCALCEQDGHDSISCPYDGTT